MEDGKDAGCFRQTPVSGSNHRSNDDRSGVLFQIMVTCILAMKKGLPGLSQPCFVVENAFEFSVINGIFHLKTPPTFIKIPQRYGFFRLISLIYNRTRRSSGRLESPKIFFDFFRLFLLNLRNITGLIYS